MSIFEGVELTEEQKATVQANHDKAVSEGFVARTEFDAVNNKREELLGETKAAKEAKRAADEEANEARLAKASAAGDADSLNASWQERLDVVQGKLDVKDANEKKATVSGLARKFVDANVVDDPLVRNAMTEALSKRLDVREGKTVVLDVEGNLTSLNEEDLFSEFKSASMYKPHLVASKASGSGADNSNSSDGGSAASGDVSLSSVPMGDKKARTEQIQKRLDAK